MAPEHKRYGSTEKRPFVVDAEWSRGERSLAWDELWRRILARVLVNTSNSEVANTVLEELDGDDEIKD